MTFAELMLFLVKLLAGIGVFLVGVHLLTANMEQLATGKIKSLFEKTANRRLVNVAIGTVATALIQSSSVTTVLIVGFVNVGLLNLFQATAMIMGANIGTTITAQIAALSALPVTTYIQLSVFIGIMMNMTCKSDNLKKTGSILAGLGLIFIGLSLMSDTMKANRDAVQGIFEVVTNPCLLFGLGVFLTAIVQSSSAVTSIIIAMSVAGLTIGTGGNEVLYIILGTNIGSCGTAVMSSLTAGTNARRAGLIHLLFNTAGAAIFLVLLLCWPGFMASTFQQWFPTAATQIAMFHTFFNVTSTLLFLPFGKVFVKVSELLIPEKKAEPVQTFLDERMLTSPSLAVSQLEKELVLLSDTAMDAFRISYQSFKTRDKALIAPTQSFIEQAGNTSQSMIDYLIHLAPKSKLLYERNISDIHSNVGDVMRIAEIADNFTKYTQKAIDKNLRFSSNVLAEIDDMVRRIEELYALTKRMILEKDTSLLPQIDEAENEIDAYRKKLIDGHVARLDAGECKPESIGVFINLVSNLERLGDHLTYIAYTAKA